MKFINLAFIFLLAFSACDPDGNNSNSDNQNSNTVTDTTASQNSNTKKENNWLCVPNKQVGLISADADEEAIIEAYGEENVSRGEVGIGEGETITATIVFPTNFCNLE